MIMAASACSGSPPPCCPTYTAAPGDTIASVAAAEAVAPSVLTTYNNLPAGSPLTPGQTIQTVCARALQYAQTKIGGAAPKPEPSG